MESGDDEFLQELQAAFQVEADEHLQVLSAGLLDLEKTPDAEQQPLLESVYREAHSLKGAARAVNRVDVEAVCQEMETVLASWKRQELTATPALFDTLHRALDVVTALLSAPAGGGAASDRRQIAAVTQQLARAAADAREGVGPPAPAAAGPRPEPPAAPDRPVVSETVRIATAKLDSLLLRAEELLVVKQTAGQRVTELRDAGTVLERWDREWSRADPDRRAVRQAVDRGGGEGLSPAAAARLLGLLEESHAVLKSLGGRVTALARAAEQDHREIGVQVDDLLEDVKTLLLLPFSTLLGQFPKMVRDLARDVGKDVQLVLRGGEVEIDKRILEEMKDPLTHLLRNSVDHGIEPPDERARRGKPARATVTVAVSQVGASEVEIRVSDDGGGIDVDRVKASAVRHGAVTEAVAAQMEEAQALALIFQSEVSTSAIITELSGRGLGMAIVREKVEKLGGRIALETRPHEGTSFQILLPLTLATFRGILVQTASQVFVIPTADVERVARIRADTVRSVENREVLALEGRLVPFVRLDDTLGLPRPAARTEAADLTPIVVLGAAEQRIAFRVDAVLNDQEVLVKTLGKPLRRVRHVAGATVLGSGKAVPILHVADLMKSAAKAAPSRASLAATDGAAGRKSVLVAEDSITSRMLLKNILETAGYQVTTAVDGLDALATLRLHEFALVVSDVDMPRMNGFDLTAQIRADRKLGETPVVLVTARDTREDRERGVDVGASAYLVKSSFDQSNLLAVIRGMI